MKPPSNGSTLNTTRPIGDVPEQCLAERITAELSDDPDVVVVATCPLNSAGHVTTALQGRIGHRVTEWLVDQLDCTGDTATYERRVARWQPGSGNVAALTANVANAMIERHRAERRRRARTEVPA